MGGGAQSAPHPIFICENNRKSNKIMNCVEEKKSLSGSFENRAIFHVSQLSDEKWWKMVKNGPIFKITTLQTFCYGWP